MRLFIDSNIYLSFFDYTSQDLEELRKLLVAQDNGRVTIYVTKQVQDEFKRNRESVIADALKKYSQSKLPNNFPQMCKYYDEYETLTYAIKEYEESKNSLSVKLKKDIEGKSLKADKVINEFFSKCETEEIVGKDLEKAKLRIELGNPPGKKGSIGDAVNWEILLRLIPRGEALHIISRDGDFSSKMITESISEFLEDEWFKNKEADLNLYTSLTDFFNKHFPDIKVASDLERKLAISNLASSSSFARTHLEITKLSKYKDFTEEEVKEMLEASISNEQISWISNDEDVSEFFNNLVQNNLDRLDYDLVEKYNEIYNPPPQNVENSSPIEIPF